MTGTSFSLEINPVIPEPLKGLQDLANDLLYSWDASVRGLFVRLSPKLWESTGHNPKVFLRQIAQKRLDDAVEDHIFMQDYNRIISSCEAYKTYRNEISSGIETLFKPNEDLVAYFCAEYGFHESFPIYSGGLGILAGDHCKAASDLGVPFVGIGMLYREGYFQQTVDGEGQQIAHYTRNNPANLPIAPALDPDGAEIKVSVDLPNREVALKVWLAKAGNINLVLLDSDTPENDEEDRRITYQLYGGNITTRIQQEIVLGIGGVRALHALNLSPTVWHINEGHAAFQILERCHDHVTKSGLDFETSLEVVAAGTVFTTHTPVPAGHDMFSHEQMREYFDRYIRELGINEAKFLDLGHNPSSTELFNMTALALRGSRRHNGVSRIHGAVAAKMESYVWPEIPPENNPINSVTNGVHVQTFLAREWVNLFDMQFGGGWRNQLLNEEFWHGIDQIPAHSFWSVRQSLKTRLFNDIYNRVTHTYRRNGHSPTQIERLTRHISNPEANVLTVGFARRFATYKRAALLFSDPERLARIVNDAERPVLFVFAGKAHPRDTPGQELMKQIHHYAHQPEFMGKVIFVEGYDLALSRKLVAGVDVWLNNPRYPNEASGTSGEKAGINGVLNLSVLDGWWGEGYDGKNGWAISPHSSRFSEAFADQEEAKELLDLLENQIIPMYYDRDGRGYPERWVNMSKASIRTLMPRFNSQRMVMDYVKQYYSPTARQRKRYVENDYEVARQISNWKRLVRNAWPGVSLASAQAHQICMQTGEPLVIEVIANLNGLAPKDVIVECLLGTQNINPEFKTKRIFLLEHKGQDGENRYRYQLNLVSPLAGKQVFKIRTYPHHDHLTCRFEMGLMRWL